MAHHRKTLNNTIEQLTLMRRRAYIRASNFGRLPQVEDLVDVQTLTSALRWLKKLKADRKKGMTGVSEE